MKIFFLLIHFWLPYMAGFWMNFGAYGISGYTFKYWELVYNQFQMFVIGDYDFGNIVDKSQVGNFLVMKGKLLKFEHSQNFR